MWTDDREKRLKELFKDGLSASQIARVLGPDVTRNGVLGKIHRWKKAGIPGPWNDGTVLPQQHRLGQQRVTSDSPPVRRPRVVRAEVDATIPEPLRLEDGDLVRAAAVTKEMCLWPYGDPATINWDNPDFHYCGHARKPDSPYCPGHAAKAYEPYTPRQRHKIEAAADGPTEKAA